MTFNSDVWSYLLKPRSCPGSFKKKIQMFGKGGITWAGFPSWANIFFVRPCLSTYFIKRLLGQIFDFTTFLICHQIEEKRMKRKVKDVFVVNSKVKTNPSLFNKGMSFLFVLIK